MKKKCQIHAVYPITCFSVPIVGHTELNLTTDEIYKCLCGKAEVVEVLPNGKMINLDFTNYNKDNYVKEEPKPLETVTTEYVEDIKEDVTEEQSEVELEIETITEVETSTEEEVKVEESPVKTHEVGSRNNNKNNNHNKNRKNNKR